MSKDFQYECRVFLEEIWSSWPDAGEAPPSAVAHAEGCPSCVTELDAFRSFCRQSVTEEGEPLSWEKVISLRWQSLIAATKKALHFHSH